MKPVFDWIVHVVLQHYSSAIDAIESQCVLFDGSYYLPNAAVEDLILLLGELFGTVHAILSFFAFLVLVLFLWLFFDVYRAVKRKKKSPAQEVTNDA